MIGKYKSLHAVVEMAEPTTDDKCQGLLTYRSRLAGGGFKPSKGALVKSHGAERLEKGHAKSVVRYG